MSGASPQGPGVIVGSFPGCQEVPVDGQSGQISYHIPPTGNDQNGCPMGGSVLTADEINGIEQAINCILTRNGQDPLPNDCLCADPCMLYDKLVELFAPQLPDCPSDASPDNLYVLTCDGSGTFWSSANIMTGTPDPGSNACPADSDGVIRPIGFVHTDGFSSGQPDHFQGQTTSSLFINGQQVSGSWIITSPDCSGTEGDCPSPTWMKTGC